MKEELFVTVDNVRSRVDLAEESGITLEFKSNLFGSLADIDCSHSYSFTLPFTRNNQQVFDMADDIRHESTALHKKLDCDFWQNGIPLFQNGNLYINEITDEGYSCVMTWDVCKGLQKLQDEECNLNELPNAYASVNTHFAKLIKYPNEATMTAINNGNDVVQPRYPANGHDNRGTYGTSKNRNCVGTPVVPAKYILDLICQKYGVTINLGTSYNGTGATTDNYNQLMTAQEYAQGVATFGKDFAITMGGVPLATRNLTERQTELESGQINYMMSSYVQTFGLDFLCTIGMFVVAGNSFKKVWFRSDDVSYNKSYISDSAQTGYQPMGIAFKNGRDGFRISGSVTVKFEVATKEASFKVYGWGKHRDENKLVEGVEELTAIDDTSNIAKQSWTFNFDDAEGYDTINIDRAEDDNSIVDGIFFGFSQKPSSYTFNFKVYPAQEDRDTDNFIDIISNLPEISCADFVEWCFRSIGAFPVVNADGSLSPIYYSSIYDNKEQGEVVDWSRKTLGAVHARPEDIALAVDDYAQNNYYLMKSDDREQSESDRQKEDDIWFKGYGNIAINDVTIDKENEVYTAPFVSAYEEDKRAPHLPTGNNAKAWEYELKTRTNKRVDVEPTYGIMFNAGDAITFKVFMPFVDMANNASFAFLHNVLRNAYIITENMLLDEFDLAELDYSKPVYLDKYNSYFAVINISRGGDGISEVELLKI